MHFVISIISRFVPSIYDIANPELAFAEFFEKITKMESVVAWTPILYRTENWFDVPTFGVQNVKYLTSRCKDFSLGENQDLIIFSKLLTVYPQNIGWRWNLQDL